MTERIPTPRMSHTEMLKECVLWLKVALPSLPTDGVDDINQATGERLAIRPLQHTVRLVIREAEALLAASSEKQPLVDGDLATQRAIHDQNIADAYAEGYGDGYEAGASAEEACRDER